MVLCDDAHITQLNLEWRGQDGPTDVLSFEMPEDEDGAEARHLLPPAPLLPLLLPGSRRCGGGGRRWPSCTQATLGSSPFPRTAAGRPTRNAALP